MMNPVSPFFIILVVRDHVGHKSESGGRKMYLNASKRITAEKNCAQYRARREGNYLCLREMGNFLVLVLVTGQDESS